MNDYLENLRKSVLEHNKRYNSNINCTACNKEVPYSHTTSFSYYRDNEGQQPACSRIRVCSEECRRAEIESGKYTSLLMLNEEGVSGHYLIPKRMMDDPFTRVESWQNTSNEEQQHIFDIFAEWWLNSDRTKGFLFYGPPGTGKTCLACLIAKQFRIQEKSIRFTEGFELALEVRELSKPWAKADDVKAFMKRYAMADLLIIDEIMGLNWEDPLLMNLFIKRHSEGKPIILTTNMMLDELKGKLPQHIWSRLKDCCHPLAFKLADQRGKANG
jgi:DNA replication protein DnaC